MLFVAWSMYNSRKVVRSCYSLEYHLAGSTLMVGEKDFAMNKQAILVISLMGHQADMYIATPR